MRLIVFVLQLWLQCHIFCKYLLLFALCGFELVFEGSHFRGEVVLHPFMESLLIIHLLLAYSQLIPNFRKLCLVFCHFSLVLCNDTSLILQLIFDYLYFWAQFDVLCLNELMFLTSRNLHLSDLLFPIHAQLLLHHPIEIILQFFILPQQRLIFGVSYRYFFLEILIFEGEEIHTNPKTFPLLQQFDLPLKLLPQKRILFQNVSHLLLNRFTLLL